MPGPPFPEPGWVHLEDELKQWGGGYPRSFPLFRAVGSNPLSLVVGVIGSSGGWPFPNKFDLLVDPVSEPGIVVLV